MDDEEYIPEIQDKVLSRLLESQDQYQSESLIHNFHINAARGYGLLLTEEFIDMMDEQEEINGINFGAMTPLYKELGLHDIFVRCVEQAFKDREEYFIEQFKTKQNEILDTVFSLIHPIIGVHQISSGIFLRQMSIVVLHIALETYLRDRLEDVVKNQEKIALGVYKSTKRLQGEQALRTLVHNSTFSEEVVDKVPMPNLLNQFVIHMDYPLSKRREQVYNRIILYRNAIIHNNGKYSIRNERFAQEKDITLEVKNGTFFSLRKPTIRMLYSTSLDLIQHLDNWTARKYNL